MVFYSTFSFLFFFHGNNWIILEEEELRIANAKRVSHLNKIDPSVYQPSQPKNRPDYSQRRATIVPPSDMVQEFLEKIEIEKAMGVNEPSK